MAPWLIRTKQPGIIKWGERWGSNPRPPESQSGALPTELRSPLLLFYHLALIFNGAPGRTRTCNPQLRRLMLYPVELRALRSFLKINGRGGEIRTPDPLLPKQLRYQAALHPDTGQLVNVTDSAY